MNNILFFYKVGIFCKKKTFLRNDGIGIYTVGGRVVQGVFKLIPQNKKIIIYWLYDIFVTYAQFALPHQLSLGTNNELWLKLMYFNI